MKLYGYQSKLIQEVHDAWRSGFKSPCVVLPCGGGKTIIASEMAKRTTANQKSVIFLVHRKELCNQVYETFENYGVSMDLCSVGMVQTVSRHIEKYPPPALIITDENHHSLASSYRKIYSFWDGAYRVGITATPIRLGGGGLGDVNDKLIIGPGARELIDGGFLSDFDYYAPPVADLSGLKARRGGDFAPEDIEQALNRPQIYGDVINHYRSLAGGKQAICYCATINHSMQMAETFRQNGISAEHIDGETPKDKRSEITEAYRRGDITVLCNVDLISEGFDVPDCTASILMRPTKSLTLFIQQSMRCMRFKSGKRAVIIDHVGNVHRFGLPDQEFHWELTPKREKSASKEEDIKVRQCPECFYTHEPSVPACPNCGYVYPVSMAQKLKEAKEARLERITATVRTYSSQTECKSMEELHAYAKMKGYKPGWAYHTAKEMHFIRGNMR